MSVLCLNVRQLLPKGGCFRNLKVLFYGFIFSESEALDFFTKLIEKINSKLPILFGPEIILPEILNVEVKPVPPPGNLLAYYMFVLQSVYTDLCTTTGRGLVARGTDCLGRGLLASGI